MFIEFKSYESTLYSFPHLHKMLYIFAIHFSQNGSAFIKKIYCEKWLENHFKVVLPPDHITYGRFATVFPYLVDLDLYELRSPLKKGVCYYVLFQSSAKDHKMNQSKQNNEFSVIFNDSKRNQLNFKKSRYNLTRFC